ALSRPALAGGNRLASARYALGRSRQGCRSVCDQFTEVSLFLSRWSGGGCHAARHHERLAALAAPAAVTSSLGGGREGNARGGAEEAHHRADSSGRVGVAPRP